MSVGRSAALTPRLGPSWQGSIRFLYAGFDGLDVAFQGRVSDKVLEVLDDARADAEALNERVARELDGLRFTVAPSGARNGFRYRLDTGDDGEVWLVKHNADPAQWNLFASVRSYALLTHGYPGVKRRLLEERLAQLEATVLDARPNRVDFACDLDAPGFEPEPDCFVAPARTRARSYHPGDGAREGEHVEVHRLARRVNGITVGRMPGRQLCLYDKRADSLLKRKLYWAAVWGRDLAVLRDPVWRVEARAARDEIKTRWRVRSFAELEGRLGEMVASALSKARYVAPSPFDTNPSRWPTHPLWDAARAHMAQAIEEHAFTPAPARNDLPTPRLIKRDDLWRQLIGLAASCGAVQGLPVDRAGDLPGLVAVALRDARARPAWPPRGEAGARPGPIRRVRLGAAALGGGQAPLGPAAGVSSSASRSPNRFMITVARITPAATSTTVISAAKTSLPSMLLRSRAAKASISYSRSGCRLVNGPAAAMVLSELVPGAFRA